MKRITVLLALMASLLGCEKLAWPEEASNTPQGNFDALWETLDRKYAYFDLKGLDWDSVYHAFAPRINAQTDDEELFAIMDSMLYLLRDGHVNLSSPFNLSRNWRWYLDHPANFSYDLVERHYLTAKHRRGGGLQYILLPDSVGYLYFGSFSATPSEGQLREAFRYLAPGKGLIVDIRNNGGGSLGTAYRLASCLIEEQKTVIERRYKTGPAPGQFEKVVQISLAPHPDIRYPGPVVLLTNRQCYSAANTFAAILSLFDKVQIIGDTTGGGGGLPVDNELPNGWYYRFSATRDRLIPSGWELELGIGPDLALDLDSNQLALGRDNLIEQARLLLR